MSFISRPSYVGMVLSSIFGGSLAYRAPGTAAQRWGHPVKAKKNGKFTAKKKGLERCPLLRHRLRRAGRGDDRMHSLFQISFVFAIYICLMDILTFYSTLVLLVVHNVARRGHLVKHGHRFSPHRSKKIHRPLGLHGDSHQRCAGVPGR